MIRTMLRSRLAYAIDRLCSAAYMYEQGNKIWLKVIRTIAEN
jgi:hypothetical protein